MSKFTQAAGTSPFAHLLAGAAALGARSSNRRAEDDEDKPEGSRAEDPEDDEDKDKPEGSRAEDPDDEDKDKPEGKGRKGAEQDPADDSHDDDDGGYEDEKARKAYRRGLAIGRARENRRASRIFSAPTAAKRPDLAATLAFSTRNSSAEATVLLDAAAAGTADGPYRRQGRLDSRMGNRSEPRPGAEGGTGKPSFGERVAAAVKKSGAR